MDIWTYMIATAGLSHAYLRSFLWSLKNLSFFKATRRKIIPQR